MKKFISKILKSISFAIFALPVIVSAQVDLTAPLVKTNIASTLGGGDDLIVIIGNIVTALLSILGVIFIILIIYAGFKWMLAQGDEGKIDKAKKIIYNSIFGLVIIFLAYAITIFVFEYLINAGVRGTGLPV